MSRSTQQNHGLIHYPHRVEGMGRGSNYSRHFWARWGGDNLQNNLYERMNECPELYKKFIVANSQTAWD